MRTQGITYDGMCWREPTAARTDSGSAAKWVMCDGIGATRGWFGRASNNFGCNLYMRAFPSYLATSPRLGSAECAERLNNKKLEYVIYVSKKVRLSSKIMAFLFIQGGGK